MILTAPLVATLENSGHALPRPPRHWATYAPASRCEPVSGCLESPTAPLSARRSSTPPGFYFPDPELATAGVHFMKVLRELGIADQVAPRLHPFPNGATGDARAGPCDGARPCRVHADHRDQVHAGRHPRRRAAAGFELSTIYSAAIGAAARERDLAAEFVRRLTAPASRALREAAGFE
jgi:molybdate transport system substrate-binding protein